MFHSTMVRAVRSHICVMDHLWTFSQTLSGLYFHGCKENSGKDTHTEKVFVIPSASTYSGADGGPHWRDEKKKEAGTCLPPKIPVLFACSHLPACRSYSSSCMMLLLELFPCLAPLYRSLSGSTLRPRGQNYNTGQDGQAARRRGHPNRF
ncbi:hypothetical protein R3I93_021199 [Phoxinus phoxinus]|uniref:Uncharacterized protein n=1 Tax=Phoxinus phoxinus TaxID=58324 RepID=A0AAN9C834_9TELE